MTVAEPRMGQRPYTEFMTLPGRRLDNQFHVAQTLHSLANLLSKQGRVEQARAAYDESIEIGERLKNDNHLAQVLRS